MPARWIDLLMRVKYTFDDADADLTEAERNLFYSHVQGTATLRQVQAVPRPAEHPLPAGDPLHSRDPSGE